MSAALWVFFIIFSIRLLGVLGWQINGRLVARLPFLGALILVQALLWCYFEDVCEPGRPFFLFVRMLFLFLLILVLLHFGSCGIVSDHWVPSPSPALPAEAAAPP